ncbi:MAG: SpaH/EbpB family LPXTG-anchored major pilin [Lachnospiraceae bacterium]|jgi:fimbrial isopeptide formation D2 family protein/LPXTG-motif cell wall-anchored protein
MKKFKKMLVLIMAMAMILGMSVTALAAANTVTPLSGRPSADDKGIITVSGVEDGATVKAYQVVTATYKDGLFTGYQKVDGVAIANIENIAATEVNQIAKDIKAGTLSITPIDLVKVGDTYKTVDANNHELATAPVGSYVIIVTPPSTSTKVYSPLYGSVAYGTTQAGDGNTLGNGNIDVLESSNVWVKLENGPKPEKNILSESEDDTKESVTVGSTVTYELKATLPDYSVGYTTVKFNFVDTLSEGLTYDQGSYTVFVAGTEVAKNNVTETVDDQTVTFALTEDFIRYTANDKEVKITYTAKVNNKAASGFNPNTNEVYLDYSNSPDSETESEKDTTKNYAFDINGLLKKVDNENAATLLPGAEFKLFADADCKTEVKYANDTEIKAVTGEDGMINFYRLNEGTYYLQETKAPGKYQLSKKVYQIVIDADFDANGDMTQYTITITDMDTNKVVSHTYNAAGHVGDITVTDVKNTKLSSLPSTGGIGTTIFTIGGCAIMIIAAGLFFASRRKSAK